MTEPLTHLSYKTLDDIRLRKAQLLTEITKDGSKIEGMWNSLFHAPKQSVRPTSRVATVMKTGAGVFDAALLGWKLYRKFGGKKSAKRKKGLFRL